MSGLILGRRAVLAAGVGAAGSALAQTPAPPEPRAPIAGSTDWEVVGPQRAGDGKVADLLGRTALLMRNSTHIVRRGVDLADGVIAFDMAPLDHGDFVGVTFRREGFTNHENVYLRLSRSGEVMAAQYAPRLNGSSTWQLYPEFRGVAVYPRNAWTPVRLEIAGSELKLFVGASPTPVVVVPRLRHRSGRGEVAVWARANDRPEVWAAGLSNIRIEPAAIAAVRAAPAAPPDGFVRSWRVSFPYPADTAIAPEPPRGARWMAATAEESGLVNINRRVPVTQGRPQRVWVTATVTAARAGRVKLGVGYSDDATVFLNGAQVFTGRNGFDSRGTGVPTFVDTATDQAEVDLRAGDNTLTFVVTDDQRFGWGLAARFDPASAIRA